MTPSEQNKIVNSILKDIDKEIDTLNNQHDAVHSMGQRHLITQKIESIEKVRKLVSKYLVYDIETTNR